MRIAVIGGGAWGTALATIAADNEHEVVVLARRAEVVRSIQEDRENLKYLPGVKLSSKISATSDPGLIIHSDILLNATPTQFIRATYSELCKIPEFMQMLCTVPVVNTSKGVELHTHQLVSQILADVAGNDIRYSVLSGPSHAEEVVQNVPTTIVCASTDVDVAALIQRTFSTKTFRVYTSRDVVGVEIGGALKNVIAIASGIVDGLKLGDNTKAALITRGLAEMARLGVALGAHQPTFFGLAGLGDLYVTCSSRHSRNRYVGEQIGQGRTLKDVLHGMDAVAEGVTTTKAAIELAQSVDIELPITEKVAEILFDGADPMKAIYELMLRPRRSESEL